MYDSGIEFIDRKMSVSRAWEEQRIGSYCLMVTESQFGLVNKLWKWRVVMVAHYGQAKCQ